MPHGKRGATSNRDEASRLLANRLEELEEFRAGRKSETADPLLEGYARRHLKVKAEHRKASTVRRDEVALRNVLGFFGDQIKLSEIGVRELTDYLTWRRKQPGRPKDTTVSEQTLLHELHALSSLYKRAIAEGAAQINPVSRLPEKPRVEREEREWLESGEAARLLKAASLMDENPHPRAVPYLSPLLATFLLTGGRATEVFGMQVEDVDFEHIAVHIRPNKWRTLKRPQHRRWVPLWPQLEAILREYMADFERTEGLLFPSRAGKQITSIGKSLRTALDKAEIEKHVTLHTLRHTYAAARIQTTDHGAPVSPYTVMRELGHSSIALVEKTYGHLMQIRHRSAVVEYQEAEVIPLADHRRA